MSTPESKVKDKIKAVLKKHGVYWHMPVQNGLGAPTLDFVSCMPVVVTQEMVGKRLGLYLAIEAKPGSKQPTDRQIQTMRSIRDAGGLTFLVNETEVYGVGVLDTWLQGD